MPLMLNFTKESHTDLGLRKEIRSGIRLRVTIFDL